MARRGENIYHRKDGRWEARYIRSYEDGKARYGYLYASSYLEVKAKKAEMSANVTARTFKPCHSMMDFECLCGRWLSDIQITVKESTYTRYERTVRKYLNPLLGSVQLCKLEQAQLNRIPDQLLKGGGLRKESLAPKTVCDIISVLKSIIRFGNALHYFALNPNEIKYPSKKRPDISILSEVNRTRIESQIIHSEDTVSLGILFALFTGVRIGELCGLQWNDIDFTTGIVSIHRTVERIADLDPLTVKKTKVVVSEPKTASSIRSIPLPRFLLEYLLKFRGADSTYLLTGCEWYCEPHLFYMRYKRYMKDMGMEQYTFHALRHTFATRCVELGFDTKSLSEILGHSNITTTLSIYVHPTLEQKQQQMNRLTCSHY